MRIILYLFLSIFFVSCLKYEKVDLVVHNAKIYTVNESFEIAQAMAIHNGKIVAIGKEREIMNKYRATDFLDAQTQPIYPGFIDGHCHFMGYGLNKLSLNLSSSTSIVDITTKLQSFKSKNQNKKWIIGYGWDENNWKNKQITNKSLNELFPNTPVLLWRVDGHSLLVNNKAIEIANIPSNKSFKNGIIKDPFINDFVNKIKYSKADLKQALKIAQNDCVRNGLTTVSDAGLTNKEINTLLKAELNEQLDIRIYAMLKPTQLNFNQFKKTKHTGYIDVSAYKLVVDGSFGSETACLLKPYENSPNNGKLLKSKKEILTLAKKAKDLGFQLNTHCIGDSAIRLTLNTIGELLKTQNDLRWRIEHAQLLNESDLNKFSKYSIIPSVQPSHGISDMNMAHKKIGKNRLSNSYLIKTLLKQNGIITFGTDFPVEDINPIKTFYAATIRTDNKGNTKQYLQKEKVNREQALKAITFWAAMANFQENNRGSLEVGKHADFVILNRDIIMVPENEILKTEVINTFVSGYKVY